VISTSDQRELQDSEHCQAQAISLWLVTVTPIFRNPRSILGIPNVEVPQTIMDWANQVFDKLERDANDIRERTETDHLVMSRGRDDNGVPLRIAYSSLP